MSEKRALTDRAAALPALAEAFRAHGFEGASLSTISKATGLGKGSLYNFFPGGKDEMMAAVLANIDHWFEVTVFGPLERASDPASAINKMMRDVETYFQRGGRVCLIGMVGLGMTRDPFAEQLKRYFVRWISALANCLALAGVPATLAARLSEDTVAGIQGAIVLSRALNDNATFMRVVRQHEAALLDAVGVSRPKIA